MDKSSLSITKRFLLVLQICFFLFIFSAQANDSIQKLHKNKLWFGVRLGQGLSNFKGVDNWLVSAGLASGNQNIVPQFCLGIDMFYEIYKVLIAANV